MQRKRTRRLARAACSLALAAATLWGVSVTAPAGDARSALEALRSRGGLSLALVRMERGGEELDMLSVPSSLALRMTPLLRPAMPPVAFVACTVPEKLLLRISPSASLQPTRPPVCDWPCTTPEKEQRTI